MFCCPRASLIGLYGGVMRKTETAIRAAREVALAHGVVPDRCEILQDGSTLVLRLTESLVARIVQDAEGPRSGPEWFARENALALHLAQSGAPVIPLHPGIAPGPHEHLGCPINFWRFVTQVFGDVEPEAVGGSLFRCHELLARYSGALPRLGILFETQGLLGVLEEKGLFSGEERELLRIRLEEAVAELGGFPMQPLHGDAHPGNVLSTTEGLLWTDWEDAFLGPVEWDLASVLWNARHMDGEHGWGDRVEAAYRDAGGSVNGDALEACYVARAAVMTAWYPLLYPNPDEARKDKLRHRLRWLRAVRG
jgi:hypothetical protein